MQVPKMLPAIFVTLFPYLEWPKMLINVLNNFESRSCVENELEFES